MSKLIDIHAIEVGDRHRKDMGDLEALAASIRDHGLLQPVGITKSRKLVFGERRLRACRDILNWTSIPYRTIDIASIVEGEYAENQVRKDFTPKERVAIAKEVEKLIGSRQGKRDDGQLPANLPEVKGGAETREIAAKAAGFGSATTYRDAKTVVDQASAPLVAAMDRGDISISTAAKLVSLSPLEQAIAVTRPKAEIVQLADAAAAKAREEKVVANVDRKSPKYVTLSEWGDLSFDERAAMLDAGREAKSGFNRQEGDLIDWAQWSWNPVTGCLHDCPYCYARDIANRFYEQKFAPSIYPARLSAPRSMKVPDKARDDPRYRNVFVCSMSDLFGRWVPPEWVRAVLDEARDAEQWNFLFLTKFPKRMSEFAIPPNAWMGTTVDCQARVTNAERSFERVECDVKWLSVEPMIEPLKFKRLDLFAWIVIGGASASTQTPAWYPPLPWVADLERQAQDAGCRVYYKPNLFRPRRELPHDKAVPAPDRAPDVFHYLGRKSAAEDAA